jgi:hypothetical protein
VDILDRQLARATQDLVWRSRDSTVRLYLTPEGCVHAGFVPGVLQQLADGHRLPGDRELVDRVIDHVNELGIKLPQSQQEILDRARVWVEAGASPVSKTAPVRRITIVGAPIPNAREPNNFLDKVLEVVAPPADRGDMRALRRPMREVYRASSVLEIQQILLGIIASDPSCQISLQLVSHASAGILWLGRYGDTFSDQSPYYYLDSDPDVLVHLSQLGREGRLSDVTVVGCDVATASDAGNGYNGRTLMYTLAELFRCKVVGATDSVHWSEFKNGDYVPDPAIHSGLAGWQWHEKREPEWLPPRPPHAGGGDGPSGSFSITAIEGASLFGPRGRRSVLKRPIHVQGTEERNSKRLEALQFVAPEIAVAVRVKGSPAEAQGFLLRGGQLLRIDEAYYRVQDGGKLWQALHGHVEHCHCGGGHRAAAGPAEVAPRRLPDTGQTPRKVARTTRIAARRLAG